MPTLRCASTVLTMIGCRRPASWTSGPLNYLYKAYGVVVLILVQILTLVSVLDVVFNVQNQDEFSDNLVLTLPMLITCCKFCSFLTRGNSIMLLIDTLQQKPYLPDNADEMNIETKHDKHIEKITSVYISLCEVCIAMILVTALLTNGKKFGFRLWIPFDYSASAMYAVIFFLQAVSVFIAALMNLTYDALFSGLMFCIYSQLEILGHRLRNITRDQKESAKQCAKHHNFLFELVTKVNKRFRVILCIQFLSSMMIICFILYRILKRGVGSRIVETFVYAFCMLMQIFYYCWYGNEVRLKSLEIPDFILASNWVSLDRNTKKTLLMIMVRATFPMQFTSAHIVSMNLDSFMTVLKTSYSAYNVLQRG